MARFDDELVTHLPLLRAFARRLTHGDAAFAEDLVQDTCVNALQARTSFTPGTNMKSWLFTILRNRFLSLVKRHGHARTVTDDGLELVPGATVPQDGRLQMLAFEEAFGQLRDVQRQALTLAVIDGCSYEQIAATCHCEVGTIKSRIKRARTRLADLLADDAPRAAA